MSWDFEKEQQLVELYGERKLLWNTKRTTYKIRRTEWHEQNRTERGEQNRTEPQLINK